MARAVNAGGDGAAEAEDEHAGGAFAARDGTPPIRGDANGGAGVFLSESAVARVEGRVHDAVDAQDADAVVVIGDLESAFGVDARPGAGVLVLRAREGGSGEAVEVARVEPVGDLDGWYTRLRSGSRRCWTRPPLGPMVEAPWKTAYAREAPRMPTNGRVRLPCLTASESNRS